MERKSRNIGEKKVIFEGCEHAESFQQLLQPLHDGIRFSFCAFLFTSYVGIRISYLSVGYIIIFFFRVRWQCAIDGKVGECGFCLLTAVVKA